MASVVNTTLFKDNSLFIISEDENFKGNIDLKPFYLDLDMNLNEFDIKNFLKENSIFINEIKINRKTIS